MKTNRIVISALLCVMMIVQLTVGACAAVTLSDLPKLTGETSRTVEYLTTNDGKNTGVRYTTINLSGHYGSKIAYVTEFSLADTHLSVDVLNNGTYMVSRTTVASAAKSHSKNGKTVLSALNGDLYMTSVHSNTNVTRAVLSVPRGVMIIDGEVWATEQIDQENLMATNIEKGTPSPAKSAFGVTYDNQPLVGSPVIEVTIYNKDNGKTLTADGLNRLPATNSIIVYNHRVNTSNYALNDSYEVELEAEDPAFNFNGITKAVVKAIYPTYGTARPSIGEKTIVITARGDRIKDLLPFLEVGDKVEFTTTVSDRKGKSWLWENVKDAIGGHMNMLYDNDDTAVLTGGEYPTSLIGVRNDGSVMFCAIASTKAKTYAGLKQSQANEFCRELGFRSAFYLDGGGSTTSVTLKNGTYTVRNNCSDGSARSVINSVAVVWNDTPVCKKQGTLTYMGIPDPPPSLPDIGELAYFGEGTDVGTMTGSAGIFKVFGKNGEELPDGTKAASGQIIAEYAADGISEIGRKTVIVPGDVNGDGAVNSADSLLTLRNSAGLCEIDAAFAYAADIDGNQIVSSTDAMKILRFSAGLIPSLN